MGLLELTTVLQLIDAHDAEYHTIWKSLLAILYKQDETLLYQYIHTFLQQQGLTTRLLDTHSPLLCAETQHDTNAALLCYLNYDSVAPPLLQAQMIAAHLMSIMTYQRIVATRTDCSPINLKWCLGQKNFSYTKHLRESFVQQPLLFQADAYLWYEPCVAESTIIGSLDNPILATGTKGYLSVELQVQTAQTSLHSHYGAIVPNAAWRLLWALNSLKDQREDILIEGFYDTLLPLEDDAFQQLADLPDTADTQAAHWGMSNMLLGLQGKQMHYAHILTPTCTINMLNSGEETLAGASLMSLPHSIPATARAIIDFYLVPGQNPADIFDKLKKHLRSHGFSDMQVTLRYAGSPAYTPASNSFVQSVSQIAKQIYGQTPIVIPVLPEHIPVWPFTQNSSRPVIILPFYRSGSQAQSDNEQQALQKKIAHLTYTMLCYGRKFLP